MKIATFNANSLRARLNIILDWLNTNSPDILCVQETKVQDKDFPLEAFAQAGYKAVYKGQKSYNGVAIFSLSAAENIQFGFKTEPKDEARLIRADIADISIVNTYIPQGQEIESDKYEYKLQWLKRLGEYFAKHFQPNDNVIWLGDFNIAPQDRDVYAPKRLAGHVCFNPELTECLKQILSWGFVDLFRLHCGKPQQYTFWDYRMPDGFNKNLGWRIDHIMATKPMAKKCIECYIDTVPRAFEKPSDHTFVVARFIS